MESVVDYLCSQNKLVINRLYGSHLNSSSTAPWACKAIFQSLSVLSKNYILRLVFCPDYSFTSRELLKWINPDLIHIHDESFRELIRLRIFIPCENLDGSVESDSELFQLNSYFRDSLKIAFCFPREPWCDVKSIDGKSQNVTFSLEFLNTYFNEKWENMLYFLVKGELDGSISSVVVQFMEKSGLMQFDDEKHKQMCITALGYEYMLKGVHHQVTLFIIFILNKIFVTIVYRN